jgi:hypothetical protein
MRVGHILAAVEALKSARKSDLWKEKGVVQRGDSERYKAYVEDEVKEYTYLVGMLEWMMTSIDARLAFGKKIMDNSP